jgi:hypothetical protein
MLIFALSAAVIFAVVGLSIDAGVGYFNSTLEERAAEAAALAGVTDMPNGWATGAVAGQITTLAQQNGFATTATAAEDGVIATGANGLTLSDFQVPSTCGGAGQSPCVAAPNQCGGASQPVCARNRLLVQVCVEVPATFLALVGFGNHVECQEATAEYLPPITLGQPGSELGSTLSNLGQNGSYYFLRSIGWDAGRGQGDAFTGNPADPGDGGTYDTPDSSLPGGAADEHSLNETASPATDVPWTDFPFGTLSVDERGGQNYLIQIPANTSAVVDVYNPGFGPDANTASGCVGAEDPNGVESTTTVDYNLNYHECDGSFSNSGGDSGVTAAEMYSATSYSLFSVGDTFNDAGDQLISQTMVYPIDARDWQTGQWYDVYNGGGTNSTFKKYTSTANPPVSGMPSIWHNWVNICAPPTLTMDPGLITAKAFGGGPTNQSDCVLTNNSNSTAYYRLRVDTLDYNGSDPARDGLSAHAQAHKGYAVELTVPGTSNTCSTCEIGALNDLTIYTPISTPAGGGSFMVPLMSIPPEYAGENIDVDVFDPGDVNCTGNGCNTISIFEPDETTLAPLGPDGATWLGPSLDDQPTAIGTSDCAPSGDDGPGGKAVVVTQCDPNQVTNNTASKNLYNGTWVQFQIAVPPLYNPGTDPSYWYWYLSYTLTGAANASDTITATAGFDGSPLHLVNG